MMRKPPASDTAFEAENMNDSDALKPRGGADAPAVIDFERDRFPFAITWTPIPCLTWFFPFIGHMGIADSRGVIHDFAGPYYIGHDDMAFGRPTRYIVLDPKQIATPSTESLVESWDASVLHGNRVYEKRMHNLMCYQPKMVLRAKRKFRT